MLAKIERRVRAYTRHLPPKPARHDEHPDLRAAWLATARPEQLPPEGDWLAWLILAGRGFGKTRTGAETIAQWGRETPDGRWALVGQSWADGRDVMLEGESGLLRVLAPSELRGGTFDTAYNRSLGELYLSNGGKYKLFSSEKPRSLRGPQHHGAWLDEPATFTDANAPTTEDTTYSNLLFGLRLGKHPRMVITGTPRPVRLVRDIMAAPNTVITRGSTYDNLQNLAPTFRDAILARYEGTRLGRQELDGELLEDTPGALWTWSMFGRDGFKVTTPPRLTRVVIGVDPAASSTDDSDETGIIIAGRAEDDRAYVLADATVRASPNNWGLAVKGAFDAYRADRVIAERNNGGDMVEYVLRTIAPHLPVTTVWASRGKLTRAEPIAALYEQGRVSHVGDLSHLETQMTSWVPGAGRSPDRVDALVWALTALMLTDAPATVETKKPAYWSG